MKKLTIRIPITPVAKGRPRFTRFGGTYTPAKTKIYETTIAEYYTQASKGFAFEKGTPLHVNLVFGMPIPASTSKKQREKMLVRIIKHTKKPDLDNMVKAVLDALNGVAWADDSQIVWLSALKEYSDEPYVYIYVHEDID